MNLHDNLDSKGIAEATGGPLVRGIDKTFT